MGTTAKTAWNLAWIQIAAVTRSPGCVGVVSVRSAANSPWVKLARALGDSRIPCLGLWVLLSPSSGQDFATRQEMMREQETLEEGIVYGCVGADCPEAQPWSTP